MASFSRRVILDIGASEIRIGELLPDRSGWPALRQLSSLVLGIDPTKGSEFFPAILQGLENLAQTSGIKAGPATLCLGGPSVFSRVIKVPQAAPAQVSQMIGFEAQQAIPAIEEACWDFQIFPAGRGDELEAMILAIKKESVEEMIAAAMSANFVVDSVELAPAAIINAFRYNYPEIQTPTLLLDVGARSTNIILVEGEKIFCRVVPMGGASITQSIATDLQESFLGAETLKRAKGFVHPGGAYEDPSDEFAARISKLSRGVVTRLHTEVERSITFYRNQQGGSRPTELYLSGGCSALSLIDFFFKEKLKIPVNYLQPFRRVSLTGGVSPDVQKAFPGWTSFVGAALRSLPESPCRFNVISRLKNESLTKQKDRPGMVAAAIAATCLLIFPGVHGLWQSSKIEKSLTPEQAEYKKASEVIKDLQKNQLKVADRVTFLEKAVSLENERLRWPRLLDVLAKKSKPGIWITKLQVIPDTRALADQVGAGKKTGNPSKNLLVEISGIFETKSEESDAQVVEDFRISLGESGVLQKVVTIERETPERSADGKAEQVALKFALRGEWILEGSRPPPLEMKDKVK